MQIVLEHKNPCIASFKFDGAKISDLIEQNKNSIITEKVESYGFDFHNETLRSKIDYTVEGYEEAMGPFKDFLTSIKTDLVKILIDNSSTKEWPVGSEKSISAELYLYSSPFLYRPGFFMPTHKDNRMNFAAGCLNLEENESVTFFTVSRDGEEVFRCSGEKNKGYVWLNTDDSFHTVDLISKERKVVIFNFVFAQF